MNYIQFNDSLLLEQNFTITTSNRAFSYGDGLFETMVLKKGKLLYLEDHFARLKNGLSILSLTLPSSFSPQYIETVVQELAKKNNTFSQARVKLTVWRKPGGLVTPDSNEVDFLITCIKPTKPLTLKTNSLISENVTLSPTLFSKYKTLNYLPYILAGLEKKQRQVDELIITDSEGNLAEASSSNIFWAKNTELYTPSIDTGCIEGIMRKQLIRFCKKEGLAITEGKFQKKCLEHADLLFTSNVSGLSLIERFEGREIKIDYALYQTLKLGLDLL